MGHMSVGGAAIRCQVTEGCAAAHRPLWLSAQLVTLAVVGVVVVGVVA
jgi:hypothetical protein